MNNLDQNRDPEEVMEEVAENIRPDADAGALREGEGGATITQAEMDAVIDELIAIASRMAVERSASMSGVNPGESEERQLAFAKSLLEQEDAIRQTRPDFDLERMLREEGAFRALVLAGEPVERALQYIEPGEGAKRAEQEVLERIRRRATRPQAMGSVNRPGEVSAQERLNDDEISRIDAQLKRGHKVYLNY